MKLTWIGHSCFKLESNGYTLILDPYEDNRHLRSQRFAPGMTRHRARSGAQTASVSSMTEPTAWRIWEILDASLNQSRPNS